MAENPSFVLAHDEEQPMRAALYEDYMNEIFSIAGDKKKFTRDEAVSEIKDLEKHKHIKWHDIWHNGELAGFVIIGTPPDCHPSADYFVIQTYVIPKYRRQGVGKRYMLNYISNHPGVYCLDIIDRNDVAHEFWAEVFSKSNYSRIVLPYIEHGEGKGVHMYAWDKDRERR